MTALANYYSLLLNITIIVLFIFINRVLYKALKNPEIFSLVKEKANPEYKGTSSKYVHSTLSESDKSNILELLQQHMTIQKPFLNPELTIEQLASQLNIKPRALSQVINELLQVSFFEYINQFRIREAKSLLTNPRDKKITVLEILYEVGFNSKSSFNTVFKRHTGLTPQEFRKKHSS